ncbi:CDP-archaeol synthase [Solimonas soli]|uniref:CDP-archaeol synthase n=1 Tax=Solimonas soli TaxID=413479 RepID=UPI0004AE26A2|nr:CDP-archaeol synthase [Solimonas soli]
MHHVLQLLYLMLPVYAANMAPPFSRWWPWPNPPISRRWLGEHKTVVGFAFGLVAAPLVAALQALVDGPGSLTPGAPWFAIGMASGWGAMLGDSAKSFVKRRLGIAPGARWIPADQLDFVIGGLLMLSPWLTLSWGDVATLLALSFIGDLAVNQLAFRLGIRRSPW